MAKAVERDAVEVVEEAGWGALALPLKVGIVIAGVGAGVGLLAGGVAAVGVYSAASATPGLSPIAAALTTVAGTTMLGAVYGAAAAVVAGAVAWPVTAGLALLGLAKGASKAERENRAFYEKSKEKLMSREAEMADVHNNALQMAQQAYAPQAQQMAQQAFEAGKQQGAQEVMAQLEQHASKAEHHHADHKEHGHKEHAHKEHAHKEHAHHEEKPGQHLARELQRREASAAAAAGAQVG